MRATPEVPDILKVAVRAEDPLVRSALEALLREQPARFQAVADAAALADVILCDVGLDAEAGLRALQGQAARSEPVLALVSELDDVPAALAAGAAGAIKRDHAPGAVTGALEAVAQGLAVLDPEALGVLLPAAREDAPREALTAREREVLLLLAEGLSNKAIGERLRISEHTAKFHVNAILQKLGAQRRLEAVVRAARLGIIDL